MGYGVSVIATGLIVAGLWCSAGAAPAGFTEQKAEGVIVDLPPGWRAAPKEFLARVQEGQAAAGKILMLVQGPDKNGLPKAVLMEREDPGATSEKIDAMSDSDLKLWCDTLKSNLRGRTGGKFEDVRCEKSQTRAGYALGTRMIVPSGGPDMLTLTWTIPHGDTSLVATVMFPKSDEEKYLAPAREMLQSIRFGR